MTATSGDTQSDREGDSARVHEAVAAVAKQDDRQHARGAELVFQIATERDEKASIATGPTTSRSASGVRSFPTLARWTAIVDRLTFHTHIIETGTEC